MKPFFEETVTSYSAYLRVKRGRGRSERHIEQTELRLRRMLADLERLEDVTPDGIEARMHELLAEEVLVRGEWRRRSRQTIDHHRRELGSLFRWLVRKGRATDNPVARVDAFEWEDRADVSRPFTDEEAERFFALASPLRVPVYLFWATSGLRPDETRRARVRHLVLEPADSGPPYLQLLRSTTKNGKNERQPLHPDVIVYMRARARFAGPDEPIFPRVPSPATFQRDLKAAGLDGVRVTAEGRLSRTSLRKTFATWLDRSGESEGIVQKLMRHSTPALTREHYTHYDVREKARAVSALSFLPPWRKPESVA